MREQEPSAEVADRVFWVRWRERGTQLMRKARIGFKLNPLGVFGLFLVMSMVLVAIFAPLIAPFEPTQLNYDEATRPPGGNHLLGTDQVGRDILSRLVYGSRISLRVAVVVVGIAVMVGGVVGTVAGYYGGLVDESFMRVTDIFLAFPMLVLAMAVTTSLGRGIRSAVLAVGFTWWPGYARMIRSKVISTKNELYVLAARSVGAGHWRIVVRHIVPACVSRVIVMATLDMGYAVLTIAGLGFIGLGAQPPTPEWGFMVNEGRDQLLTHPWISTFPGLAICLLAVGFSLFGDFLSSLVDPRLSPTRA